MPSQAVTNLLKGAGAKPFKFAEVGDSITGIVLSSEVQDQIDLQTNQVKTFDNGDVMQQIVVTVQTEEQEDEKDDGKRRIFVKGGVFTALKKAIAEAEAPTLEDGSILTVTYTGNGKKSKPAYSPPKLFEATYQAPTEETLALVERLAPLTTTPDPRAERQAQFTGQGAGYGFDEEPF